MAPGADALAGHAPARLIRVNDASAKRPQPRRMRASALLLAAVLAFSATAHAGDPAASEARGRALVEKNCSMCHAIGRAGDSPFQPAPRFRELGQRYKIDDLAEALAEGLITGHPAMPEFRFTPAEVNDIVRYLKSVQTDQSAALETPAEP